jgi:ribonucleoside-diphosphate reductase alpha chain
MRVFNMATEAVKQGGTRRGANMGILRVDHPDILEFIDCKKNNADITNFNISVGSPRPSCRPSRRRGLRPDRPQVTKQPCVRLPRARSSTRIVDAAWHNGEPGIIFLDRLNRDNVVPAGRNREHQPLRRAAAAALRELQSRLHQSVAMLKKARTAAEIDWDSCSAHRVKRPCISSTTSSTSTTTR